MDGDPGEISGGDLQVTFMFSYFLRGILMVWNVRFQSSVSDKPEGVGWFLRFRLALYLLDGSSLKWIPSGQKEQLPFVCVSLYFGPSAA